MKHTTLLTLALLFSIFSTLRAEDGKTYEQLAQTRLREGIEAIARSPVMASKKPNLGQDIWKALLLLNENKNMHRPNLP